MHMIQTLSITSVITDTIIKSIKSGKKVIRALLILATVSILIAIVFVGLSEIYENQKDLFIILASIFGGLGALLIIGLVGYFQSIELSKQQEKYETIEKRAAEHPGESKTAWDLARIKLESYLNRNLIHVRWIFILVLVIMMVGFGIIIFGILKVYESPEALNPSIVVTCSGILVEFIAATFLLIYKSTMRQAQNYVNVLERINAVGMSVQILESINSADPELKERTKSELVKELLSLYKNRENAV